MLVEVPLVLDFLMPTLLQVPHHQSNASSFGANTLVSYQ
jgi:hypothetical protein